MKAEHTLSDCLLLAGDPAPTVGEPASAGQPACDQDAVGSLPLCSLEVVGR